MPEGTPVNVPRRVPVDTAVDSLGTRPRVPVERVRTGWGKGAVAGVRTGMTCTDVVPRVWMEKNWGWRAVR